jgi:hypothetical protein
MDFYYCITNLMRRIRPESANNRENGKKKRICNLVDDVDSIVK